MIDLTNDHVLTHARIAAEARDQEAARYDDPTDDLAELLEVSNAELLDMIVELLARRAGTYVVETPIESTPTVQGRLADIRRQVADTGEYL